MADFLTAVLNLVSILSRELRVRAAMLAVKCQWGAFGHPEGLFAEDELRFGIHGGDVETSLMLDFCPELVDMSQAARFVSAARNMAIPPTGPISRGWIASDLNPEGTVGDASAASAEKGRATAEHQVTGLIKLLHDVATAPLPAAPADIGQAMVHA